MGVHPARSPLLDNLERHRSPSIRSAAIADVVGRNIVQRRQGGSPAGCSNTADPAAASCIRPCSRSRCTAARCSHPLTAG